MAASAGGARGHVRILASASVMAESLAEDVARFLQDPAHRNIRVDMEERVSPEIVRGIREGVASIGLCWDAADLDGLERRSYRCDHLAIVAHPSHPVAQHDDVRFEQVLDHEFVGMPALSAVQLMLAREAAVAGKPLVYRVLVSNFDAALRVVRAGLAISVVPAEVARPFTDAFGLRLMPLTDAWARRRFAICFRGDAALSPSAQLLVAHLERCATD
jgi:DNA-binding transcriptional LysR family regulator